MAGAPINFPSNPTTNQSYTFGTKTWIYNGYGWKLQQVQLANSEISSYSTVADGTTSTFDMQFSPIGGNSAVFVSIGGIVQSENDYVINSSNNTISFTEPPPLGENVRVSGYKTVTPYAVDAANSIGAVVNANNFVGDGTTQSFVLGYTPYTANNIFVTIGGIVQPDSAYSTNNQNSSISFNTPPGLGENIRVVGYSKVNPFIINYAAANVTVKNFETTANGLVSSFDLGYPPTSNLTLTVAIDGVLQPPSTYTVSPSTNTITFLSTPANGEYISVITLSNAANVYVLDDNSVTFPKLNSSVSGKINVAFDTANASFVTANAAATTGKAIAMSIVFGG